MLTVGSNFLLNPTRNTSPQPHLQQVLPCRQPCHTWDLGLGNPCEVVIKSQLPCSQRLRLHGLVSSDLGDSRLGTCVNQLSVVWWWRMPYIIESPVKSLKEGSNLGFNPSIGKLSIKSFFSSSYIGAYFESWMQILGPPLPNSQTLREF